MAERVREERARVVAVVSPCTGAIALGLLSPQELLLSTMSFHTTHVLTLQLSFLSPFYFLFIVSTKAIVTFFLSTDILPMQSPL